MIRPAGRGDASRIAEISVFAKRAAYRHIFRDDKGSFGAIQVLPLALELQQEGALEGFYVFDDGIVRGYLSASFGPEAELRELYVDPLLQNGGVGRALTAFFIKAAKERGGQSARLWVLEENSGARRFYERFGFAFTGERELEQTGAAVKLLYRAAL